MSQAITSSLPVPCEMKIRCQCGAIYDVPESTCGKSVQCTKCDNTFVCPTPPPKPNLGLVQKNVPGTFVKSPYARSKTAQAPPQDQDAILKSYMSEEKSLEDRMRERREGSIEEDRTSNSIRFIFVGCLWIVAAIVAALIFLNVINTESIGVIVFVKWLLMGLGAQYWLPTLMAVFGAYKIVVGVMSMLRVVDIQSEEQLPSNW